MSSRFDTFEPYVEPAPRFKLIFDFPYTELSEPGFYKARRAKDIAAAAGDLKAAGLWYEPVTGTIALLPEPWDPEANISAQTLQASDYTTKSGVFEEHTAPAPSGGGPYFGKSLASTLHLTDTVAASAVTGTVAVTTPRSQTLYALAKTNATYPANQGFTLMCRNYAHRDNCLWDVLGFSFGDFMLAFHSDGSADLYWRESATADYEHMAQLSRRPRSGSGTLEGGFAKGSAVYITIIPFGRGHIYFNFQTAGQAWSHVYTHTHATSTGNRWNITAAGAAYWWWNSNGMQNADLAMATVKYKTTATVRDLALNLAYCPTQMQETTVYYSITAGNPSASVEMEDGNGGAFVPNGATNVCKAALTLTGSGTDTPWLEGYQVYLPPQHRTRTPQAQWEVNEYNALQRIQMTYGESLDDQRCQFELKDDGTVPQLAALSRRGEVNGKLLVDGVCRGIWRFERPRTRYVTPELRQITLPGKNFGAARIMEKRWGMDAPVFQGLSHPDVVRYTLKHAGFPDSEIVTTSDTVKLPADPKGGGEGEKDGRETGIKVQPAIGSPVREWLEYVINNFSLWPLEYRADGVWYYSPRSFPTTAGVTFYSTRLFSGGVQLPWFVDLESECEPQEATTVYVFGGEIPDKTEQTYQTGYADNFTPYTIEYNKIVAKGGILAQFARDTRAVLDAFAGVAEHWLGRDKNAIIIDQDLINQTAVDQVCKRVFENTRQAKLYYTWRGPWVSSLAVGDGVMLEGIGIVKLVGIETESQNARELESGVSSTYTGVQYLG